MIRIDWSPVILNSSSVDAILSFALGSSIKVARKQAWDPNVIRLFQSLSRLPADTARRRAREWAKRNGYL